MEHEIGIYGRRSLRLKGYDYAQVGAYFVTIAVRGRLALFGEVVDGEAQLNDAGEIVGRIWEEMPHRFPFVEMDAFVVMPDHVHGIVVIRGSGTKGAYGGCPYTRPQPHGRYADGTSVGRRGWGIQIAHDRGVHPGRAHVAMASVLPAVVAAQFL